MRLHTSRTHNLHLFFQSETAAQNVRLSFCCSLFRLLLLNAYKSYPSSKCTRECTTMRFKATPTAFFIGLKMNHRAITEQNNSCLSQVENLCCCPIQQKQKSRGVITASLDFFVRIAQAVHNLLMLCDSPRIYSTYWGLVILQTKHLRHFHFYQELLFVQEVLHQFPRIPLSIHH